MQSDSGINLTTYSFTPALPPPLYEWGCGRADMNEQQSDTCNPDFCRHLCSLVGERMWPNQRYPNIGIASTSHCHRRNSIDIYHRTNFGHFPSI